MGSFASKELTPQEQMREYKRDVDRAVRELDRERTRLERANEKLANDIKKAARSNQEKVVRIMAKDYVRGKKHIQKFLQLRTWLQGVGLRLQTMKSVEAMATSMKNATRAMVRMNARLNIPQLNSIMRTFGIESGKMEDTVDMMGDAMDDIFAVSDEEDEEDKLVSSVMAELSIEMGSKLIAAPSTSIAAPTATGTAARTVAAVPAGGAGAVLPKPTAGAGAPGKGPGDEGSGGSALPSPPLSGPPAPGAGPAPAPGPSPVALDLAARLANLRAGDGKPTA